MVSRSDTSKTIRRRTGGAGKKTGKGTTVEQINRSKGTWEMVPGTGTSPYNPPEWRKKKRPKAPVGAGRDFPAREDKEKVARGKAARKKVYSGHKPAQDPIPVDVQKLDPPKGLEDHKLKQHLMRQGVDLEKEQGLWEKISKNPTGAKAGGKVSKSKGGTVKKKYSHGGKIKTKKTYGGHHGGEVVASLYDK